MDFQKYYRQVAAKNGTTPARVREAMQEAIQLAWDAPDKSPEVQAYQARFPHRGRVPTPEEFLRFLASELEKTTDHPDPVS